MKKPGEADTALLRLRGARRERWHPAWLWNSLFYSRCYVLFISVAAL
jgi:hypothetical protein